MKMEHQSWKMFIVDRTLFFNNDKQRYYLMALRNLHRVKEKYRCHDHIIINNIEKEKDYRERTSTSAASARL